MPEISFIAAGVRKNGSTKLGIELSTEGMASMLFLPVAKLYSKLIPSFASDERKGI